MKPLPFSETFAHPDDPLPLHLERVAQRAAASVAPVTCREIRLIAFLAGLFHDIGKATPYFQAYLFGKRQKSELTSHAKSGAVLSWWYSGELGQPLSVRLGIFLAVLRHHGALKMDTWYQALLNVQCDMEEEDPILLQQLSSLDLAGIQVWLNHVAERSDPYKLPTLSTPLTLVSLRERLLDRSTAGISVLRQAFQQAEQAIAFVAGFGCLLSVDKIDAALQGDLINRQTVPADAVAVFKKQHAFQGANRSLDEHREIIAKTVARTWLDQVQSPLLTLTAPTGSGKTLAILQAALQAREHIQSTENYTPRIIYCLPFTSVIDQNHDVFRAVLRANDKKLAEREDILLKHHHLVDGLFRTDNHTEYQPDGAGQLLTETWQSEIVVTTFYQLLHTLLSNANSNLKRAGQLTGALVLMDEVQALPLCYWEGLRCLFQATARALGTHFVLLTATRPLIFRPQDAVELLPDHAQHFQALSRVRLVCHQQEHLTLDEFADQVIKDPTTAIQPVLIILNRRRAVFNVFNRLRQALPDHRVIALSTDLTPRDRRIRIRLIQRLLRHNAPCIVVTTQLVEAGVDVSFPVVHRDLAPLDSIIQSAGRCNRHAVDNALGQVHLWQLHADTAEGNLGEPLWQRVYDNHLIEVTTEVLGLHVTWEEKEFLSLSQHYFEGCWGRQDQVRMDQWLTEGNFNKLTQDFQLIPTGPPTTSLFVETKVTDTALWERYRAIYSNESLSPLEKDRQFRRIRHLFYERVIQVYTPSQSDLDLPINRLSVTGATYTRETGFIAGQEKDQPACIF